MDSATPITIVFSSDGGYAPYLAVAIASALEHLPAQRACDIVVMDCGIPDFRKARFADIVQSRPHTSLHYLEVDEMNRRLDAFFAARGTKGRVTKWSYTTYYRLFLSEMLPDCPRVLYLDVDILVCDDLCKIFDLDMQDKAIACVKDVCLCDDAGCEESRLRLADSGHDMTSYFNAGIAMLNLDKWRRMGNLAEILEQTFCELPNLVYPDQDILNHMFRHDKFMLHRRWNYLTPQLVNSTLPAETEAENKSMVAEGDFGIIHYAGVKPWRDPIAAPLAALWWAQARRSGLEGDIIMHETLLLRRYLTDRLAEKRIFSMKVQRLLLKFKLLFSSSRKRIHAAGKLNRLEAKISAAQAAAQRKKL